MRQDSWGEVAAWWADLFGCEKALLWQGVSVSPHARLGDYEGIFVAHRDAGCHISLPTWSDDNLRESLSQQGIPQFGDPWFWHALPATSGLSVLGPSVHSYTDHDPGTVAGVELADAEELVSFRSAIDDAEWHEGGFADALLRVFVLRESSGEIVAAANLTEFLGPPADLGVVVHPAHRGRGLGSRVGRAGTSYAVQHCGIARWRALTTNVASRSTAAALGFEDYCHQLAIRA